MNIIACIAKISEAEVCNVAGHQTHAVFAAAHGHLTHCGPLVIFRVVHEHLVTITARWPLATCSASLRK